MSLIFDMQSKALFAQFSRHIYRSYRYGSIARIRIGHSLLKHILEKFIDPHQEITLRNGLRLHLDLTKNNQNTIFWLDGDVEPQLTWAICNLLPIGGNFIDCGANCGLMGLLAYAYRNARVIFIEPHPRLAETIRRNIMLNSCQSTCTLMECAASDSEDEIQFYENLDDDGSHSVHKNWGANINVIEKVKSITLTSLIESKKIIHIDFLKIDTEGHDLAVLRGLTKYLDPNITKLIYVEMQHDRETIANLLQDRRFAGFSLLNRPHSETLALLRAASRGERVAYFVPYQNGLHTNTEVLWCGRNSDFFTFLTRLSREACPA